MTKRSVETDLAELSEDILHDLSHKQRFALLLKATEDDREQWKERLVDTIPTATYRGPDPAYRNRGYILFEMASRAFYELHTLALRFQWLQSRRTHQELLELLTDNDDESLPDPIREPETNPLLLLAELYITYHAYERFAAQIVGVDLETWAISHLDGQQILELVETLLDSYPDLLNQANTEFEPVPEAELEVADEYLPGEFPEEPLDQHALHEYSLLVDVFDYQFETIMADPGHLGL
ncbi:hypothetical protein [Halococcus qingdaonensis]|uniref:hypothetical protein n=1 Tax=Halococcus qingdaonensis TaxID=224402 RepID=UPI002116FFA1|nr:hypothetical protein [Halococcus qingdaonensis]